MGTETFGDIIGDALAGKDAVFLGVNETTDVTSEEFLNSPLVAAILVFHLDNVLNTSQHLPEQEREDFNAQRDRFLAVLQEVGAVDNSPHTAETSWLASRDRAAESMPWFVPQELRNNLIQQLVCTGRATAFYMDVFSLGLDLPMSQTREEIQEQSGLLK